MSVPTILFVDDEPKILKSLLRLFLDENYDLQTADSGPDALKLMQDGLKPTVIVSDQRMPQMGGAEFLAKSREIQPDCIRIILTGYADINAAVDAVNRGGIYRYIIKPWNDEDLKLTVRDAVQYFLLIQEKRELTKELAIKNKTLLELNEQLEEKVTERTRELLQKVKELQGRDRIQHYLLTVQPLHELLQTVLEVVVDVVSDAVNVIFYQINEESELYISIATALFKVDDFPEEQKDVLLNYARETMETGTSFNCRLKDKDNEAALFFGVPVARENNKFGVLVVQFPTDHSLSIEEEHSINGFAVQAAVGINDSQLHNNLDSIGASLDDVLVNFRDS
jgi:FixJ family two-component response regulator